MTKLQAIIDRAATFGIQARLWKSDTRLRIYAQTDRRDMSVYLECEPGFSGDDTLGAAFKVFCNTEQHPRWVQQQVAAYREKYMPLFWAYVLEHYRHVGPQPNDYGPDINAMIDEARAFEAAYLAQRETEGA
jgi:hypothetical protein